MLVVRISWPTAISPRVFQTVTWYAFVGCWCFCQNVWIC